MTGAEQRGISLAPLQLLLIEDDPDDVLLVEELVHDAGGQVRLRVARRLKDGLALLAGEPFDLVLLDLGLPDSRGVAGLDAIRASGADVPVVVLTGYDDDAFARALVRSGVQDYLPKRELGARLLDRTVHYAVERHRAERARRETEERLRLLAEHSQDIIYQGRLRPRLSIDYISPACQRLLGHPPAAVEADPELLFAGVGAADQELLRSLFIGSNGPDEVVVRYRRPDGSSVWLEHRVNRLCDGPAGDVIVQGIARDITERKVAEERLRRFATALEAAANGLVITDLAGRIGYANPSFQAITGYTAAELVERPLNELAAGARDSEAIAALGAAAARGQVQTRSWSLRRADGSTLTVRASAAPVPGEHGPSDETAWVQTDISGEVELQAQVLRAQKMESLGLLAGGIAHDFNNLLAIVMTYAELLQQQYGDDPDLREILAATERGSSLVRQLLTFSRHPGGQPTTLDLNERVRGMYSMLVRVVPASVQVVLALQADPSTIYADPSQVEQAVANLAVNAQEAMPNGGLMRLETRVVEVTRESLAASAGATPGWYVRLRVSDTGVGMDEATRARIFEPFFSTKGLGQGAGLGLSTVYGIVRGAGGTVVVTSAPNEGSTFDLYWPAVEGREETGDLPPLVLETAAATEPIGEGQGETILLVEDEDVLRNLVRNVLTGKHYHVLEARNGAEALMVAHRHEQPIDLLVTDVVMPVMSGPELAEHLRRSQPGVRIIFLSGYAADLLERRGLDRQAFRLVPKPFNLSTLLTAVRASLDK